MKQLLWKFRFAARFARLTGMSVRDSWDTAGAWLYDVFGGDTSTNPADAVDEEIQEGLKG